MKPREFRWISLISLIAIVSVGAGCVVTHELQIRRYTTSSLTNARADTILGEMTNIAQVKDGSDDVACLIEFERDGSVTTFSTGDGSIDSSAEFSAVNGLSGNVKVVNEINWCGSLVPGIIGCAPVPGNSLVVVRFTNSMEGVLWLHEFGHNKGLLHRDVANAIMRPFIGVNHRRMNMAECEAYRVK